MTVFWLIVVAVMLLVEIITMGLTTIWFSLGAVAASIASACGAPVWLQIILFSVFSVAVMLLVRPFALRVLDHNKIKTNVDELVGKQVVVIETIDNHNETGRVRLSGVEWMARSTDESVIEEGETVEVEFVSGVKLMVKKL